MLVVSMLSCVRSRTAPWFRKWKLQTISPIVWWRWQCLADSSTPTHCWADASWWLCHAGLMSVVWRDAARWDVGSGRDNRSTQRSEEIGDRMLIGNVRLCLPPKSRTMRWRKTWLRWSNRKRSEANSSMKLTSIIADHRQGRSRSAARATVAGRAAKTVFEPLNGISACSRLN